ncbi:hypothetical protein LOTGIDRAFT_131646 [Lottia gigantea]|uniref:IRF tryptophan pentad repeat domain-containing protein n=1 Tax=Lottia gigantea TaxID=225164 RepID=V3Z2C8_LOTGI|nr:hypothetical protein LOTGIDRAFT_131646 [Lottia gigantea]ESO84753.1 hypothetical protein LOTGIDRAFT_131646 [Lottia gigantea]
MVQKLCENANRRAIRPIDREKMRPWLMKRLDKNLIKGLEWIDRKNKIFQVTWRHASHHEYSADSDSSIFKCWAEHTGKFKPGDKCNAKNWKANFRCALNSLKNDIMELKDQSVTKGGNAVRIYQFLDEKYQGRLFV